MKLGKTLVALVGLMGGLGGVAAGWGQASGATTPPLMPSAGLEMPAAAPAVTRMFPLAEVRRGMRGVAYTVFEGVTPEPMEVEILGVLKNSLGPGKDMILARLRGTKPEYTGVVAGMSGSPVYIDGRLVGALSYRVGQFSKEPIAGITPIEQMLEVKGEEKADSSAALRNDNQKGGSGSSVSGDGSFTAGDGSFTAGGGRLMNEGAAGLVTPIETPMVFGGFSPETVERFGDRFRAMGMTPVAGLGGSDPEEAQPEPLVPGSAVSAILVRGDLSMAGTCTVTYVDASHLLACGHPITQYGPVEMPMTKADVVETLASPLNAFKIVNTTQTVGSFTEDRSSAILGRFGVKARMIPVEVEVVPAEVTGKAKTIHFEVLNNRQLTPAAMLVSVYQSLQGTNVAGAEMSYRLTGELSVKGQPEVKLAGMMAPDELNSGAIHTALYVNDRFSKIYDNTLEQPEVTGLRLKIEAIAERRTAVIESARVSEMEVRPGETVEVEATLRPYQAPERLVKIPVKLPDSLQPGPLRVVVSDGAIADKLAGPTATLPTSAVGLGDTVAELNRSEPNNGVYVTLLEHEAQAAMASGAMETVPLSMVNVLQGMKDAQRVQFHGESAVRGGGTTTDFAVSGSQVLNVTVR